MTFFWRWLIARNTHIAYNVLLSVTVGWMSSVTSNEVGRYCWDICWQGTSVWFLEASKKAARIVRISLHVSAVFSSSYLSCLFLEAMAPWEEELLLLTVEAWALEDALPCWGLRVLGILRNFTPQVQLNDGMLGKHYCAYTVLIMAHLPLLPYTPPFPPPPPPPPPPKKLHSIHYFNINCVNFICNHITKCYLQKLTRCLYFSRHIAEIPKRF